MNDRLKFRVWDKKSRKMLNVGLIDFRYGEVWFQELISDASPYGILREQDFEIMQCTGLKDKNGKLIFENDIVKGTFFHAFPELNFIGTIFWHNDVAGFGMNEWDLATIEVIGNIHQNSELLEKGGK